MSKPTPKVESGTRASREKLGYWSVVAIGIGGMVGGGIFAVLGLAVQLAQGGTPVAFGSYAASFLPAYWQALGAHVLLSAAVVAMTVLNVIGSKAVGEAEEWVVGLKLGILLLFVAIGAIGADYGAIQQDQWAAPLHLIAGGMLIFLAHEGFELIAIAAMLSTASAINATLYGASRISYIIAKEGELPEFLEHKVWSKPVEGLLVSALLTLIVANLFDIDSISMMGSAGFLIVFAAVNVVNVAKSNYTGSVWLISAVGAITCIAALGALVWNRAVQNASSLWVLAAILVLSVGIEAIYRHCSGRRIATG